MIGIIGATHNYRKEYSSARVSWFESSLKTQFDLLIKNVEWNKNYFSNGFNYNSFRDQGKAVRFKQAGFCFDSLLTRSINYRESVCVNKELHLIDTISNAYNKILSSINDSYVESASKSIELDLKNIKKISTDFLNNEQLSERNTFLWILMIISPYLLAGAISIRLTKVTAELKEIKAPA